MYYLWCHIFTKQIFLVTNFAKQTLSVWCCCSKWQILPLQVICLLHVLIIYVYCFNFWQCIKNIYLPLVQSLIVLYRINFVFLLQVTDSFFTGNSSLTRGYLNRDSSTSWSSPLWLHQHRRLAACHRCLEACWHPPVPQGRTLEWFHAGISTPGLPCLPELR